MMLSAHARGIGSCMIGFAEAALFSKKNRKKIGVPGDRKIGLIFTLGYSDRQYYRYPVRESWAFQA
jgi:nitroreductase